MVDVAVGNAGTGLKICLDGAGDVFYERKHEKY